MKVIIDGKFMTALKKKTALSGPALTSDALGLLNWAIGEVEKGRKIVSVDASTELENETLVCLQSFDAVKYQQPPKQ